MRVRTVVVAALVALGGCQPGLSDLDAAWNRWDDAAMADYTLRHSGADCDMNWAGDFVVEVRGGEVERILRTDVEPDVEMDPEHGGTVEDFFALVEEAIADADEFSVLYDEELGHPVALDVTWGRETSDGDCRHRVDSVDPA